MKATYYRVQLDDYSAPSFVSCGKNYYGTLEQIGGLFGEIAKDATLAEDYQDILSAYGRVAGGEAGVTHYVAHREVPFLVPANVLRTATSILTDYSWEHLNVWGCSYFLKCDRAESSHIWISCNGRHSRCVQTRFTDLRYKSAAQEYEPLGDARWGFPCQIGGPIGDLYNRLYVEQATIPSGQRLRCRVSGKHERSPRA